MMLSLDTAYRSFGGEVEASSTPTICRLSDSRRHQLSAIARGTSIMTLFNIGTHLMGLLGGGGFSVSCFCSLAFAERDPMRADILVTRSTIFTSPIGPVRCAGTKNRPLK